MHANRRQVKRVNKSRPIHIFFGEQVVIKGIIRDISEKSAFIDIGNSIYVQREDVLKFKIFTTDDESGDCVSGEARVSRIAPDEGIAIYFTDMDRESAELMKTLLSSQDFSLI